jgi:hypothetical protein
MIARPRPPLDAAPLTEPVRMPSRPPRRFASRVSALVGLALIAGCDAFPLGYGPSLAGDWTGVGANGVRQTLAFESGGTGVWTLESPEISDTVAFRYAVDHSSRPHHLELSDFDHGPLEGRTLYGIFEQTGEVGFRVDFEPGPPDADTDEVRPDVFTRQTVLYTRAK